MGFYHTESLSPGRPPAADSQLTPGATHQMRTPLTVLDDAMLLQRAAQLQCPPPALRLSVLKEPVDQLATRKGALVRNTVLLSQLQDGALVPYETEETRQENTNQMHHNVQITSFQQTKWPIYV